MRELSGQGKDISLLLCLMFLGHLVLGGRQSLPQLGFIKLLLGTDGLPDVRHDEEGLRGGEKDY